MRVCLKHPSHPLPFFITLQGFESLLTATISFDRGACRHRPQLGSEQGCLVLESVPLSTLPPCPHPEDHEVGGGQEVSCKHHATLHGFGPVKCAVSLPLSLGPLNAVFCITSGVLALGGHRMLGHKSMSRSHGFLVGCTFSITGLKYKAWHSVPRPKSHGGLWQAKDNLCTLGDFPATWNLPQANAVSLLLDAYVPVPEVFVE